MHQTLAPTCRFPVWRYRRYTGPVDPEPGPVGLPLDPDGQLPEPHDEDADDGDTLDISITTDRPAHSGGPL